MSVSLKSDSGGTSGAVQLNGVDVIPFNSNGILASALLAMATAAGFAISLAANGYIKFPSWLGGLIVQWGRQSYPGGGSVQSTNHTFPVAFPNALLSASATIFGSGTNDCVAVTASSTTGLTIGTNDGAGGTTQPGTHYYIAIGY